MEDNPVRKLETKLPGKRQTRQRLAIHHYLSSTTDHPTAEEIYYALKASFPKLSLATVYNTLELLMASGQISAIGDFGDHHVRFDRNPDPHINLICSSCHNIQDVHVDQNNEIFKLIYEQTDFVINRASILYYGICSECQNKDPSPSKGVRIILRD